MATSDQIIEQLSNDKLDLEATKNATINVLSKFMEKKELAVNSVRDHKAELVTELSKLEKESMRQIDEEYGNTERNLQNAIKEAEGNINELVQFKEKLEFLNEIKVQSCLAIKMAQKAIAKAKNSKELLQELSDVKVQTFHGEFKLKNYIQQTKSLGHLCVEEEVKELYTVNEQRDVDIKISTDKKTCRIFGTCLTDNGCLLLADCNNKNIKRIDVTTEKVTDHLCLEAAPNAVCQTSKDEAAVSLSNNNIQFISLANEMTATRSLEMDHYCSGLAYNDGELFMTNGSSTICTLDRENTYIQKRLTGKSGKSVFSKTRHMCLSTNKEFMYVADMDKGLITLEKQGSYVSSFNDPDLIDARAVCTDGKGTMFACGFKSPCIIQIREDSKRKLGILKSKLEHLSICFDPNQNRLYVTYDGCDLIKVFDLK